MNNYIEVLDKSHLQDLLLETSELYCSETGCHWTDHEVDQPATEFKTEPDGEGGWQDTDETYQACPWCGEEVGANEPSDNREELLLLITSFWTELMMLGAYELRFEYSRFTQTDSDPFDKLVWWVDHPHDSAEYEKDNREYIHGDMFDWLDTTPELFDPAKARKWITDLYRMRQAAPEGTKI